MGHYQIIQDLQFSLLEIDVGKIIPSTPISHSMSGSPMSDANIYIVCTSIQSIMYVRLYITRGIGGDDETANSAQKQKGVFIRIQKTYTPTCSN